MEDLRTAGGGEPFRVPAAGVDQGGLAVGVDGGGVAVVEVGRGVQADSGVAMWWL